MKYYPLKPNHSIPMYAQLSKIIKRNIGEKLLKEGDRLPSESELMEAYGISRLTVRNALLRLEYEGQIFRVHGRGSYVASKPIVEIVSPFVSFDQQLRNQGIFVTRKLIEFSEVYPPEQVISVLKLPQVIMVTKVKSLLRLESICFGLSVMFLPTHLGNSLKGLDLSKISLVDYFNNSPETHITKMEAVIRAALIEEADAEIMEVDPSNTVLIRNSTYWSEGDIPIMTGKVLYLSQYAMTKIVVPTEGKEPCASVMDLPGSFE